MAKLKSYTVMASVTVFSSVTIKAASLKEAIEHAEKLAVTDFVQAVECLDDSDDFQITGVYC